MSIQYDLYDTPDIQQTGDAQPLHPRVVFKGTVDQEEFLDRVHKFTGISRSLLAGAMQSFQNELRDLIANGWIVELGDIGYFSVQIPTFFHWFLLVFTVFSQISVRLSQNGPGR